MNPARMQVKDAHPLLRYALLGIPLGFLGLPLYMHLPHYYATSFNFSLTVLGGIFLISRLVDCVADPFVGRWLDRCNPRLPTMAAALCCAAGMGLLFGLPAWLSHPPALALVTVLLIITYLGYSVLSIRLYAGGVALASATRAASTVSSWREAMLIVGVLLGAAGPGMGLSYSQLSLIFILLLAVSLWIGRATILSPAGSKVMPSALGVLLRNHGKLYAVFFFNALPPAITATLYLFYMEEVLSAPQHAALLLLAYFIAAMIAMPLWVKLAKRFGNFRCLGAAMLLAIVGFIQASQLTAGDSGAFLVICLITGVAFGADAALLPSLLSQDLARDGTSEHSAFGIWMAISKLTLALGAGLALPLVDWLQQDGATRAEALRLCYGLLPCIIKCFALLCLISYHRNAIRSTS